jgi:hypothetical protein
MSEKSMSIQDQIKQLKEQRKMLDEQTAKLREGIAQVKFDGNKRAEIGAKGTMNIYGLGRFPVCLYLSQLQGLNSLINTKEFADFINANTDKLAVKEKKQA